MHERGAAVEFGGWRTLASPLAGRQPPAHRQIRGDRLCPALFPFRLRLDPSFLREICTTFTYTNVDLDRRRLGRGFSEARVADRVAGPGERETAANQSPRPGNKTACGRSHRGLPSISLSLTSQARPPLPRALPGGEPISRAGRAGRALYLVRRVVTCNSCLRFNGALSRLQPFETCRRAATGGKYPPWLPGFPV